MFTEINFFIKVLVVLVACSLIALKALKELKLLQRIMKKYKIERITRRDKFLPVELNQQIIKTHNWSYFLIFFVVISFLTIYIFEK